jgi:prepilin-type N-terminal cleavage/methylation domain-containing protein
MKYSKAFTLIEVMIAVAIIGVLAAVAIPRFANLLIKSKESATTGGLTSVRSTLNIYNGTNHMFPTDNLASLTSNGLYISAIPPVKLPGTPHQDSTAVSVGNSTAAALTDSGGWAYVNDPASESYGTVFINCSHLDSKGQPWNTR